MKTGGGGSIGSELCRQIATFDPKQLIILDNYENSAYDIQNELLKKYPKLNIATLIANVREKPRLEFIFEKYKPNIVFHAAAHKHVPLMELNPTEAIKNNVFGTLNVAECSDKHGVERFVMISTDKAMAQGGEIFVLDMGEPVKIYDLARSLIKLSGFEPEVDIKIEFTGLRPGEKLYEELLLAEEGIKATSNDKIFVAKPIHTDLAKLRKEIASLKDIILTDNHSVSAYVQTIVPNYSYAKSAD